MKKFAAKIYDYVINPPSDEELSKAWQQSEAHLPTLWLLGKTGAGKSSIIQQLTGQSGAEIGNGYMPCTARSRYFDYPPEHPILRFLDTRGLGEVDYDASEDLTELSHSSHALIVVAKIRDGEQSAVLAALDNIRKSAKHIQRSAIMVVHTGADDIPNEHDRLRAVAAKQAEFEQVWGSAIDHCLVEFSPTGHADELNAIGADQLREMIVNKLPELSLWLRARDQEDAEKRNFDRLSTEVLWYAGTAAASDAIPLVGLVSVPAIQGKMLHSLAQKYAVDWDRASFSEFVAALGTSFALRYGVSLGSRQLGKLVPGWGQLAGAAVAVTISYASTYAIGRAACSYLYHKKTNTPIDEGDLKSIYDEAVAQSKQARKEARQSEDRS